MTDQQTASLGAVLDRVYRAVHGIHRVTTDGFDYHPYKEAEYLAAELDHTLRHDQPGQADFDPYGRFAADAGGAAWRRHYRFEVLLRVMRRAGAAPDDVEMLRAALGIEPDERLGDWMDSVDERNEQARRYWVEHAIEAHGHELGSARDTGREEAIREAFALTGDNRLKSMTWGGGLTLATTGEESNR